jgi:hypothetical protein
MTILSTPVGRTIAIGLAALALAGGLVGPLQAAPARDALGPEMRDRWYLDAPMDLAARAVEPAPAARDRWYLD